jgi:hypothetical protein
MISWQYYPKSTAIPDHLFNIVQVFVKNYDAISSGYHKLSSNEVLSVLYKDLVSVGFNVEKGKKAEDRIEIPVLFGRDGKLEKCFHVDGFHAETGTVIEVEAGRAVDNYQFLKDFFEACVMTSVNYLVLAVRKVYGKQADFEAVVTHFDTLFASGRLKLPLQGILVVGY